MPRRRCACPVYRRTCAASTASPNGSRVTRCSWWRSICADAAASQVTGAGTYGWRNHARDVLGVADAVGAPSFAVIGQSSGAAIAMTCAQLAPSRVERLVLVDLAGSPDERAGVPVVAAVSRLGTMYPSAGAAIALVRQLGIVPEWDEYWDRYFATNCATSTAA